MLSIFVAEKLKHQYKLTDCYNIDQNLPWRAYYIYTCKAYINSSITKHQIIFIPIVKYKSKLVSGIMVYACYALSFTFINKQTILGLSKSRYTLSSKPTTHK